MKSKAQTTIYWNIQLKTEKMKAEERLKLYKKALKDYRKAYWLKKFFKNELIYTHYGFCFYFNEIHNLLGIYHCMYEILPELWAQKPNEIGKIFWFKPGYRKPRIKCLKAAIKLTKQLIK